MLENYEPKAVWKFFEEISYIPRGSGNEKGISDYLVEFAKKRNLLVHQDETLNVIIKKSGSSGYENAPKVIIQGHIDMVCEKDKETVHDFEKDPLKLIVEGDYIKACGTTLGADDGIAVALALALLDSSEIAHPPIEALFTTGEEMGLIGANALDGKLLEGRMLINIDSEEEGVFTVSCAGGVRADLVWDVEYVNVEQNHKALNLKIQGLQGGHSGTQIQKERANANRLIGRALRILESKYGILFTGISGGSKDNAIPREAEAIIVFESCKMDEIAEEVKAINEVFESEFAITDEAVQIFLEEREKDREVKQVFTRELCRNIISALMLLPNGVQANSFNIEGLVETSSNIGILQMTDKEVIISSALRSSVPSRKEMLVEQIKIVGELTNARFGRRGDYPAWEYNKDSELREKAINVYTEMFGSKPKIDAIHAGLECGCFAERIDGVDMISMGSDLYDAHTPQERLSISSSRRTWEFLQKLLIELAV